MLNKKVLAGAATAALIATMALAGCGSSSAPSSSSASSPSAASSSVAANSNNATSNSNAAASSNSAASPSASTNTASSSSTAGSNATTSNTSVNISDYIGTDAAKEAALKHAGISLAEATDVSVELDTNDAVIHYDVEFKAGGKEYDYDIDASNGNILSSKSEVDD